MVRVPFTPAFSARLAALVSIIIGMGLVACTSSSDRSVSAPGAESPEMVYLELEVGNGQSTSTAFARTPRNSRGQGTGSASFSDDSGGEVEVEVGVGAVFGGASIGGASMSFDSDDSAESEPGQLVELLEAEPENKAEEKEKQPEPARVRTPPTAAKLLVADEDGELAPLDLRALRVDCHIDGPRARTTIDYVFRNPFDREIEGTFFFPLPEGASVAWFGMFQGPGPGAEVLESGASSATLLPPRGSAGDPGDSPRDLLVAVEELTPPAAATEAEKKAGQAADADPDQPTLEPVARAWGELREAQVVEPREAVVIYEQIVRGNIDPALLEWAGGNNFNARVFPIPAGGLKRIALVVEQTLPRSAEGTLLYHRALPRTRLDELEVHLSVDGRSLKADRLNLGVAPVDDEESGLRRYRYRLEGTAAEVDVDLAITPPDATAQAIAGPLPGTGGAADHAVFARVVPEVESRQAVFSDQAIFCLDTSLSEEAFRFEHSVALLKAILSEGSIRRFAVCRFDLDARWLDLPGHEAGWLLNTPEVRAALWDALDALELEGATNLEAAARAVASAPFIEPGAQERSLVFVLSDGHVSWGQDRPDRIAEAFAAGDRLVPRFFAYQVGAASVNAELFQKLARGSGGALLQAPSAGDLAAVAAAHRQAPLALRAVRAAGARSLELAGDPRWLYPGQELVVAARFDAAPPETLTLEIESGVEGEEALTTLAMPLSLGTAASPLAARAWAEVRVANLVAHRDPLEERLALAWSQQFGIASRLASLLILETDEDLVTYDIAREETDLADPAARAAFADWRLSLDDRPDRTQAQTTREEMAVTAIRLLLEGHDPDINEALAGLLKQIDEAQGEGGGDLRAAEDTLLAQALGVEALCLATQLDDGWKYSAQVAWSFLVRQQHADGAWGNDRRRAPSIRVTAAAARAMREARRVGLRECFGPSLHLATFLSQAPLTATDPFAASRLGVLLRAAESLAGARGQAAVAENAQVLREMNFDWADSVLSELASIGVAESVKERQDGLEASVGADPVTLFLEIPGVLERLRDPVATSRGQQAAGAGAQARSFKRSEAEKLYRKLREESPRSLDPFLDVADARFADGDEVEALRALSSIVELHPRDPGALRMVGYACLAARRYDAAHEVFRRVLDARPFEPHSHRDLAKALEGLGLAAEACVSYEQVLGRDWHGRFQEVHVVVAAEYERALRRLLKSDQVAARDLRDRLGERLERLSGAGASKADLRVTISWNTDGTDIDLWIIEPNGEKCYYEHKQTSNGGVLFQDLTGGYGPERYQMVDGPKGTYQVVAHYFSTNPTALGGKTFVHAVVTWHAGTPQERSEERVVVLHREKQAVSVLTVELD